MVWPPPERSQCQLVKDPSTTIYALILCTGLIISYLPQSRHVGRVLTSGLWHYSRELTEQWYLLLGATSSASGMLNMLVVQWPLFQCCRVISGGQCFQTLLGFIQVTLQWSLFTIMLKYQHVLPIEPDPSSAYGSTIDGAAVQQQPEEDVPLDKAPISTTPEWRLAITLGIVVFLHLSILLFLSLTLLILLPPRQQGPTHPLLSTLATFFGLSATVLSICQYAPQIYKTYRARLVGALSTGTMFIQVPGSALFVLSIISSPGTNWTSWLPYAVTGAMQACLLAICLVWRRRQRRLGVNDFGIPVDQSPNADDETTPLIADS